MRRAGVPATVSPVIAKKPGWPLISIMAIAEFVAKAMD
jgi:hypothetical protein